ncbi:MAG TPA: 5-oxoprolinase subunit PxpA [Gaiellaceae bacterium]
MEVDLNADVGEGLATDEVLLRIVTSANVACGFHAGDEETMARLCSLAAELGVAVGAHVSYRDREGFGRRDLDVDAGTIERETLEQVQLLQAHGRVAYVKPHGALYHRASVDDACAAAIVAGTLAADGPRALLAFPGSRLYGVAREAGLVAVAEGFADRGYDERGQLVARGEPGALLAGGAAVRQAVALAGEVGSICLHGDSPGAVELARDVADGLRGAGFDLRPFA